MPIEPRGVFAVSTSVFIADGECVLSQGKGPLLRSECMTQDEEIHLLGGQNMFYLRQFCRGTYAHSCSFQNPTACFEQLSIATINQILLCM